MSTEQQPVHPTPFTVAPASSGGAGATAPRSPHHRWIWPALGALALLAALVIFWLPDRVAPPATPGTTPAPAATPAPGAAAAPGAAPGSSGAAAPQASPWSDAQAARARREVQELLPGLLDLQEKLEAHGVQQWAAEPFATATAAAAAGDEHYRARRFEEAMAAYRGALAGLEALAAGMPAELAARLATARQALDSGDATGAAAALEIAALLGPDHPDLAALQGRLAVLPQVRELLDRAAAQERDGELAAAQQGLREAAALDGQHPGVAAALARVTAARGEREFQAAMSAGYGALEQGRLDDARRAFQRAAALHGDSAEAAGALQEVHAASTAQRLAGLQRRGRAAEDAERWQDAVTAYEEARAVDASVLFAGEGLARARPRAQLDADLRGFIDRPERLVDAAVAAQAQQLVARGRGLAAPGPVLAGQLDRLQTLLQQASTPVAVTLRSDQQTEVTVQKVARLGRFTEQRLDLRPGTYTAVGSRDGYRDVRRQFTVRPDGSPEPVTIACTERI